MASTIQETTSLSPDRSPSRHSNCSNVSPRQNSPSGSPGRQRKISFSEDTHPNRSRPSTPLIDSSNHEAYNSHPSEDPLVGGQDHDRVQNLQPTSPSPDQPSPSSSLSDSSQSLKQPWYRRVASNYRSISLENKGSVARDHLALERTFLAWLRTSLAFASIGIAITQLFRLNTSLANEKAQRRRSLTPHLQLHENEPSLPLSPLMGASLTPDIYQHIQTTLQQQQYPIYSASENHASTLLDHLLRPTAYDSDSAARLRHLGKPLGATFLGISIVILFIGFHRYFESQHWIIRGQFPASRGSVALVGLIAVTLIVASLVVVLVVAPAAYNTKE
jgi:uncharacterized membrane protein YidH (DUF202 family)